MIIATININDKRLTAPSRWRLVRAGTLVLIFLPTIRQQSRLLPQCHEAPWSSLDSRATR